MKKRLVWLILAILWSGVIWSNSLQPAEVSGQASGNVVDLVEPVLTELGIPAEEHSFVVRKSAHLTEFAILGMLWLLFFSWKCGFWPVAWALGLCAATAALDESIQHFVSGRSCELRDFGIDILGAAVGIGLLTALGLLLHRSRKN